MMWTSEKQFWAHCSFSTYGLCDLKHGIYFLKLSVFIWVFSVLFTVFVFVCFFFFLQSLDHCKAERINIFE